MVCCRVDGQAIDALDGDTVLTALLLHRRRLRRFEFADQWRAGFCLIGACQDCWVRLEDGTPVRACTTPVTPGMTLTTAARNDA